MQCKNSGWISSCAVAALAAGSFCYAQSAGATPASGFTGATLASGTFEEFEVFNQLVLADSSPPKHQWQKGRDRIWLSLQKTRGDSDLYVQSNTWAPGASTGWHRHPGHSLIIITSGQVTQYHEDCSVHVYGPGAPDGNTLVDTGNDAHLIRNEGAIEAKGYAVQLIASGATRRIDVPTAPEDCQVF